MSVDLLSGALAPRRYAGEGWQWYCWDGLVAVERATGAGKDSLFTSLDGGETVLPLASLPDGRVTNLRVSPVGGPKVRLTGEVLARGPGGSGRLIGRSLRPGAVAPWPREAGGLRAESSGSEMLLCRDGPSGERAAAWRVNFQKRWAAIQHLAVAPPGEIERAGNLLTGGLDGGALPRLEAVPGVYNVRAARGSFSTHPGQAEGAGSVSYHVQLGPLVYDLAFGVGAGGIELGVTRDALADVRAFVCPVLELRLSGLAEASREGGTLSLRVPGARAVLRAESPLRWYLEGDSAQLRLDDFDSDLGLTVILAGRRQGIVRMTFETG